MTALYRLAFAGAMLALAGIGLRPTWPGRVSSPEIILVTPGADAATVRRLTDSLPGAAVVTDPDDLPPAFGRVHVVGWGLTPVQWSAIGSRSIAVHPAQPAVGFARASWNAEIVLGDALVVEGQVVGFPPAVRVSLTDPAGRTDSVPARDERTFAFTAWPRGTGRQIYRLQVGDHPAAQETLAVVVIPPPQRRVLVLRAVPSFETSALRDWLAGHGDAVAIRTALSRDRYRTEFVNRTRIALSPLTDRLLAQFDVVQIDGRSLAGLSVAELAALRQAVEERGLGVLVVPDTTLLSPVAQVPDRRFFFDFGLRRIGDLEDRSVRPHWPGMPVGAAVAVRADPYALLNRFGVESIIDDGAGNVQAQVAPRGTGRVGLSLVVGSSHWLLTGERATYSAFWARLLAALSAGAPTERVVVETAGPWLANRPLVLRAERSSDRAAAVVTAPSGARDTVFLARDPYRFDAGRGVYWPRETGWHQIEGAPGSEFFVQGSNSWVSRQAAMRQDATAWHSVMQLPASLPARPARARVPIPRGWWFGMFVLCTAVLWSARRPTVTRNAAGTSS